MNQHLVETVVGQTSLVCLEVHELPRSQNQHAQRKIRDSTAVVTDLRISYRTHHAHGRSEA